jgi:hypothetical protein
MDGIDRGPVPFIERYSARAPEGFDGILYVGETHSSVPAVRRYGKAP